MTIKELWNVSPQNFIFIIEGENTSEYLGEKDFEGISRKEYHGEKYGNDLLVDRILATSYPMYRNVIEVITR